MSGVSFIALETYNVIRSAASDISTTPHINHFSTIQALSNRYFHDYLSTGTGKGGNSCKRKAASAFLRLSGNALPELLGEPDEKSFGAADVAEPIRVFILNHFTDELRAALLEPGEQLVDVVHGEHDA